MPEVVFESRVDSSSRRARLFNDPVVDFSGTGELHRWIGFGVVGASSVVILFNRERFEPIGEFFDANSDVSNIGL